MGLSVVFGIVKQHNGFIDVSSEVGIGSEFRVYLPSDKGRRVDPVDEDLAEDLSGSGRILLAEDDAEVRRLAQKILGKAGYSVQTVGDGEAAVREAFEAQVKFDLIILDLVMPKMNGDKAFEGIRERGLDTPVIFCTGYSDKSVNADTISRSGAAILQKPYTTQSILRAVRQALARHAPGA